MDVKNNKITLCKLLAFPLVLAVTLIGLCILPFLPAVGMINVYHKDQLNGEVIWPIMLGGLGIALVMPGTPGLWTALGTVYICASIWPLFMFLGWGYNEIFYKIFPAKDVPCELP